MDNSEYTTKRCVKCEVEYPSTIEYFYQRKDSKDGFRNTCKRCFGEQSLQYHSEHREHRIERHRQYRLENLEYFAEYARQWNIKNRERISEYHHQYYLENRERRIEKSRQWYAANREKMAVTNRQYKLSHRQYYLVSGHRYRARKRSLPNTWTEAQWVKCLKYWGHMCAVCEYPLSDIFNSVKKHADHWIPLSYKGVDNPGTVATNMICLCDKCNHSKNDSDPIIWLTSQYGKRKANQIFKRVAEYFKWIEMSEQSINHDAS